MIRLFTKISLYFFIVLSPALLYAQPQKIMCLGNSITQGDASHTSYRFRLWKKLIDAGIDFEYVGSHNTNDGGPSPEQNTVYAGKTFTNQNEGHWGWRADELLNGKEGNTANKLENWMASYTPDVVLMHVGTNDVFQGHTISSTADELKEIINVIRSKNPNVTIMLAQLIDANLAHDNIRDRLDQMNVEIASIANSYSTATSTIILVDQHTGFDAAQYTYDNVHPNEEGEEFMAQRWYDALQSRVVPLPVLLVSFKASYTSDGDVELQWTTASERNNAYFEIQRANDSIHFAPIGTVKGAGTSQVKKTYNFLDTAIPDGELYYRLMQVDTDGSTTYSSVVTLSNKPGIHNLTVYPTIATEETVTLHVQQPAHTPIEVSIYTANGMLVQTIKERSDAGGNYRKVINLDKLRGNGLYLIKSSNGPRIQRKFIIDK